jgi:hypothetical protein
MSSKPISIKASVGKSGGGALKAVGLTTGGLLHVVETRLEKKRFFLSVQQKSPEGHSSPADRTCTDPYARWCGRESE